MMDATWNRVARSLLGSWPQQVAGWGEEGIAAYIEELQARGLTPDVALVAIRSWPAGSDFPPSAPNLAAVARRDPSVPTFDELFVMIYGPKGVLFARAPYVNGRYEYSHDEAAERRARTLHPLAAGFISQQRIANLRLLEVDHDTHGALVRKDLAAKWDQFREANEGRELAALASGKSLRRFDPLAALGAGRLELVPGDEDSHGF